MWQLDFWEYISDLINSVEPKNYNFLGQFFKIPFRNILFHRTLWGKARAKLKKNWDCFLYFLILLCRALGETADCQLLVFRLREIIMLCWKPVGSIWERLKLQAISNVMFPSFKMTKNIRPFTIPTELSDIFPFSDWGVALLGRWVHISIHQWHLQSKTRAGGGRISRINFLS